MDVFSTVAGQMRPQLRAAALAAASRLGLWPVLAEARSAAEAALLLGVSDHRLAALLDVLALEGAALRGADGRFVRRAPPPPVVALPAAGWGLLAEVIRSDRPLDEPGVSGEAGEPLRRFHDHLRAAGAGVARELMTRLARDPGGPLLDLGSGAGAYAAAILGADPDARAVLVDRPAVLDLARSALGPLAARATLLTGDLFEIPLRSAVRPRVALLANLLHLFDPPAAAALVKRAAAAVAPGGLVVIKDLRLDDDHRGPPEGVLFSLNMAVFTSGGRVHDTAALRGFLSGAGLEQVTFGRLDSAPDAVVATGRVPNLPDSGGGAR